MGNACSQNIYNYLAHSQRLEFIISIYKSQLTVSFMSVVDEDHNLYEKEGLNIKNSDYEIDINHLDTRSTSKMTNTLRSNWTNLNCSLCLKGFYKTKWSAKVKATKLYIKM